MFKQFLIYLIILYKDLKHLSLLLLCLLNAIINFVDFAKNALIHFFLIEISD